MGPLNPSRVAVRGWAPRGAGGGPPAPGRPALRPGGAGGAEPADYPRTGVGGAAKEVTVVGGGGEIPSAARKPRSITYVDNVRTSAPPRALTHAPKRRDPFTPA